MTQLSNNRGYDLEERTAKFGENVVGFCNSLKLTVVSTPIVSQLVRSATSIGANYMEANNASSKRDFRNKIYICKKETEETKHWLRMLVGCYPTHREQIRAFWKEAQELVKIFQKIVNSLNA